ncbi:MAG TPA: hypothetical protein PLK13_11830 [Xanthobacteraceae bacterium]|nr:hypothetical protein [Xanthobacteraceae bacterium]HQS46799.1 hypothetical protein [Xanthobacteraceae bacterium]
MDIAGIWGDVEQGVIDDADRIILDLENMLATLKETLKEKAEAGEHIGL